METVDPVTGGLSRDELAEHLKTVTVVTLWPTAGRALGLSRSESYRAAKRGTVRALKYGRRIVVPSKWLESELGLNEADER
jgi:hypothetical protein